MNNEYKHVLHALPQKRLWLYTAILCTGGLDVIRKEAWTFCRTISGVRLCWELEQPTGPNGPHHRRPFVVVSRPRSWSHLLVLGAISWAFIVKS